MKHAALPDTEGGLSVFEQTCSYCGARFRVLATPVADVCHREEYGCPDSGMPSPSDAARAPLVQLLRRRTDGKDEA
ncbi:MAG: hypothetical protein ACHP7E_11050, partial [Burkholderiales bacterium]